MKIQDLATEPARLAELGRRLALVRRQRGLSQEQLAEAAGVGVATVRRIEDGKDARLGSWLRLLEALGMLAGLDQVLPEEFRSPRAEVQGLRRRPRRAGPFGQAGAGSGPVWGDEQP
jgi:transcriptional regulator with XRE-family HTH domain